MKIDKDIFLKATAEAMMNDSTQKLFKAEPVAFDMFSMFAFAVLQRIEGKDITEDDFSDTVASVIVDSLPDEITDSSMLKDIALVIFSLQIWTELEKLDKPDQKSPETEKFKSELKSAITR